MISVVIPVKDGGADLVRCLEAIGRQACAEPVEVVVVDSGSGDGSVAVARAHGAVVHEIPPHTFTHGGARNLGAGLARGELLAFISQDAVPVDEHWLDRLVAPLRVGSGEPDRGADRAPGGRVAGVYGRQLPHAGATPPERYFLDFLYGPSPRVQRISGPAEISMATTLFSNVNAAMPRSVWERYPFAEDIVMSEDQEWSRRVLLDGHTLVYAAGAPVRHSHNYTLRAAFQRFFDSGVSAERAYMGGEGDGARQVLRSRAAAYAVGEMRWLWRTGQRRWIPYTIVYETTKLAGLVLGTNHRRLPRALRRRFSHVPDAWESATVGET